MKSDGLVISDRLLRSWLRCPRKAWQDLHDNPSRRTWHPQRAVQLGQEQRCLSRYGAGRGLVMARGTPEALRGAAAIQGLRLLAREGRFQLRGRIPLLLRRDDAKSQFGPWIYVPLLVRTGRFINREQRLCLAFLGRLLQGFQGQCPPHGLVLSGDGACQQVSLDPLQPQLDQLLEEMAVGLSQPHPPELIAERKRCAICSWRRPCNAHAAASGHLGDVSGVGAGRRRQLIRLQIHTIAELARSDPLRLGQALAREGHPNQVDHHNALAAALALQARSQQSRQAQRRPDAVPSIRNSLTTRLHQVP
ncbi:MAG TPA: nuclease, partial [Synechococcus sp. UBA8638]|nr:nuclease [Synechococcus sp. UBA8638]